MVHTLVTFICTLLVVSAAAGTDTQPVDPYHSGMTSYGAGDWDAAIDAFKRAVESDPSDSMYRTWLGRAYIAKLQTVSFFEKGMLSGRALEQLKKAVEIDPTNVEARVTLASYYLNAPSIAGGSKKKAREQAVEIGKYDRVRGDWVLAGVLVEEEKYDEAIETLERCTAAQPDNVEYRYRLAMACQKMERYDEAFAQFEEALDVDPDGAGALYQMGRTAVFSSSNLDRGIECLRRYLTLQVPPGYPGHDAAHWRLGMLYERKGDYGRARDEFETALKLNPEDEKYRRSLNELAKD